jgi:hypothetical protein
MTDVRTHMFVANADSLAIFPRVQPPRVPRSAHSRNLHINNESHHHESISEPAILGAVPSSVKDLNLVFDKS